MGKSSPANEVEQSYQNGPFEELILDEVIGNCIRLIQTRWVAGLLVLLATAFVVHILKLPLPEWLLYATGMVILAYNAVLLSLTRRVEKTASALRFRYINWIMLLQVALDWLSMAFFLHFTGGICSPATPFVLIHMLMITILLPERSPYLYVVMGVGVLVAIALVEMMGIVPHYSIIPGLQPGLQCNPTYVWSKIAFITITAFSTVYLTSTIMARLRERERQITALFLVAQATSSTLSLNEVMQHLAHTAAQALSKQSASIRLLDESGERLAMTASYGLSQDYLDKGPVDLEHSRLDQEALLGQPVVINNTAVDKRIQYPKQMIEEGLASLIAVPIMSGTRPLGVLRVYSRQIDSFTEDDTAFVMTIARQGATALQNALSHEALYLADQERAQFVQIVTHELRAPVSGAQSLLRVMLRGLAGEVSPQQQDILGRLSRRLDILMSLINDLLDLAASKTTALKEPLYPVSLIPVIQQVVDHLKDEARAKDVTLHFDAPSQTFQVSATEQGLSRIFTNLIGNAIKYTLSGGTVAVVAVEQASYLSIIVEDNGIGIPGDELPHLWEEFFRASNVKQSNIIGTGLGLSIVKHTVERYGGRVGVRSVEGQGTTFTVTLPLLRQGAN